MSTTLTHATEPRFSFSVPTTVPTTWRKDVSKIETLMEALRARHSEQELAQLIVLAATRSLTQVKRPQSGLATAMVRGVLARETLKNEEGGAISADEAREFLGNISKTAVLDRFKKGQLLGWRETRQNAVRFPVWQFTTEGVLHGLEEVLAILRASPAVDEWGAVLFFLNKRASLNQERPLDVLRRGDLEAVKQAAQGYVE
jgi:hypothetical protein